MRAIIINELSKAENSEISTAIDDYSLRHLNDEEMILHFFQHTGINMGLDDTKMTNFENGMQYYKDHNIPVTVRNAGGRSVVSDAGVLNMSLVMKSKGGMAKDYDYFDQFIRSALRPISSSIETGMIHGAYCPRRF